MESVLSTVDMVDEVLICVDPNSDSDTLDLVDALKRKFNKVRSVDFVWPMGKTGDGSVIGIASSFGLNQARTSHVINIQADELYPVELSEYIRNNWKTLVDSGRECFRLKVLNLQSNMQEYQGGNQSSSWEWQSGAGYNHSYKLCKKCLNTKFLHDAWSFDWRGFVVDDIRISETYPVIHAHDNFRDSLIKLRQSAADEIWTDREKFGHYKATADGLESTVNEWWDDPKWTNTDSPFAYLLPDYAKRLLGKTTYVPDYSILESF